MDKEIGNAEKEESETVGREKKKERKKNKGIKGRRRDLRQ